MKLTHDRNRMRRITDARELYSVIDAIDSGLLAEKRAAFDRQLRKRKEILP